MASKTKKTGNPETGLQTTTASGPSPAMLALFAPRPDLEAKLGKMQRRNMPQLVKPDAIPVGGVLIGRILEVSPSPVTTVKGQLLRLEIEAPDGGKTEISFPLTGVIRNALCPGIDRDNRDEIKKAIGAEIGKLLVVKRQADKPSKIPGRAMFMFDVYTSGGKE